MASSLGHFAHLSSPAGGHPAAQLAAPLQPQLLHLRDPPADQTGRRHSQARQNHRPRRPAAGRRPVPWRPRGAVRIHDDGTKSRGGAGAARGDHRVRQLRAVHRRGIQRQGHVVLATSRSDYSAYCSTNGIRFFRSLEALCEEQPDVLLVCSSILSTESVVRAIPFGKLRPDTIVADVLSVKQFPRNLLLEILPPGFGIVCTHPMFGPESGEHGWSMLPFVYDKVRLAEEGDQIAKCDQFLSIFEREGCRMVEMSCAEHDRHAAGSQFITHTIGRVLAQLNLKSTPINTKGYETLLQLTENTVSDSFDLYYGLFM